MFVLGFGLECAVTDMYCLSFEAACNVFREMFGRFLMCGIFV